MVQEKKAVMFKGSVLQDEKKKVKDQPISVAR